MNEWPPQASISNSDNTEKEPELPKLNNRREYMLKKYNEVAELNLPLTEESYESLGGSNGILNKLVETGLDADVLKDEFLSISNSNPEQETEKEDVQFLDNALEHVNVIEVREDISKNPALFEIYSSFKKAIISETGNNKVKRIDILNKMKEYFSASKFKDGFAGSDYGTYLDFMSILHSANDRDNYEDDTEWVNEKLENIDLGKVNSSSMAQEMKNDKTLNDYYQFAKKKLLEKTGESSVTRSLIISEVINLLDNPEGDRTASEAVAAHKIREIYYSEIKKG